METNQASQTALHHFAEDQDLARALRRGEESAYQYLVDRYGPLMLRVASRHVRGPGLAQEVVQDTWLNVVSGIGTFEGRSSLKTWIFRILVNRAKTRGARESRMLPFSALMRDGADDAFQPELLVDREGASGRWAAAASGDGQPELRLIANETLEQTRHAIKRLPASQRSVIAMRDVEGHSADEVCSALGISGVNQRVLLHRARSAVRRELKDYLGSEAAA